MQIVNAYPPNFQEILQHFPEASRKGVIFTYGPAIYAPRGVRVSDALIAHEAVHSRRQAEVGGPEKWWRQYIDDVQFRFDEELMAHRAEYRWFVRNQPQACRQMLHEIAMRLSSKLYGKLVRFEEAKRMVAS